MKKIENEMSIVERLGVSSTQFKVDLECWQWKGGNWQKLFIGEVKTHLRILYNETTLIIRQKFYLKI